MYLSLSPNCTPDKAVRPHLDAGRARCAGHSEFVLRNLDARVCTDLKSFPKDQLEFKANFRFDHHGGLF